MKRLRARGGLFVSVVLALMAGLPPPSSQAQHLESSTIVFLSNRDRTSRGFDILLVNLESRKTVNITKDLKEAGITSSSSPRILQKHNSILYFSPGAKAFREFNLSTSSLRQIVGVEYEAPQFDVSADQRSLLFTERMNGKLQLVEVDIRSGSTTNLSQNGFNNSEPRYSPDGTMIAYVTDKDGSHSIGLMKRNGSNQGILTNNFGDDRSPRFSPDGRRIVFMSSRSAASEDEYHLYTVETDGKNFTCVHESKAYNAAPQFSGDGSSIVFVSSNRVRKLSHILIKDLTSKSVTNISKDLSLLSQEFSISPNGRGIVFENNTIADSEIMYYDITTRAVRNLTNRKSWDCSPSF